MANYIDDPFSNGEEENIRTNYYKEPLITPVFFYLLDNKMVRDRDNDYYLSTTEFFVDLQGTNLGFRLPMNKITKRDNMPDIKVKVVYLNNVQVYFLGAHNVSLLSLTFSCSPYTANMLVEQVNEDSHDKLLNQLCKFFNLNRIR